MSWLGSVLLSFILAAVIARPFLPNIVRWYVNRTLDQSLLYKGRIGDVSLHLWRGAYSIDNIRLSKTTGDIPVPLFSCSRLDLAIEWGALRHGKIVGTILIDHPEINFVDAPSEGSSETGAGGPWLKMLRDLFPFDINSAQVVEGSVHFRTYQKAKPVDVYLSHMQATLDDLTNVGDSVTPLLATVKATATAMDSAKFEMLIQLDPFSYDPTFHLAARLMGLDMTLTNDLIETYGGFDVKRGLFDLVIDVDAKEGQLNGYIKPLFRNMQIFSLVQDVKEDNVLRVFWQAIVGGTAAIITNYNRDQLGTLIPFTGNLSGPKVGYLQTLGNVLRNAFIRAYLPRLENGQQGLDQQLLFGPATLTDPISVGN